MFIRKHVAMLIKSAVVFFVFGASTTHATALALNDSEEAALKLDNLGLRVVINASFEQSHPSTRRWKNQICDNFFRNLKVGQGPWGFGLFQTKAGCEVSQQQPEPAPELLIWTLNIALNEQQQGFITLCRPYADKSEKCEASVTIPASRFLPELLNNDSYARLIAAALLDQMPFRSKLTSHLLGNDGSITPKDETHLKSEFPLPPFPSENTLLPVSADILIRQSKFRVELKKEPPATLLSQPNIWLVSNVRGSMGAAFSTRISDATEQLGVRLLEITDLDSKAHTILGRNARRKAKANRLFRDRVERIVEARFGGTFRNSKDNAMTADVELLLTEDVLKNLWLGVNWVFGNYRYKVESNFKVPEPATDRSANRSVLIASIGTGIRWSSQADHTLFFFPRLEFGRVTLKANRLAADSTTLETDTNFVGQFAPATGFSVGYQSPERWPVQWQARLGATGWNQEQHRSITADIAAYIPLPIAIVSQRTEIFGFGTYQSTDISQSDNVSSLVKSFSIKIGDTIVGGGLRLLWL